MADTSSFARSKRVRLIAGFVILIVIGIGVWLWTTAGQESTDDAQVDAHVTQIAARVGGTVAQVPVNDNQSVDAGTLLVQIDPRDYQLAVDKAKAALADAQAAAVAAQSSVPITATSTTSNVSTARSGVSQASSGVTAAQRGVDAAKARVAAAQSGVSEAEANATKTARDVDRLKGLLAKDEVSQQQYDAAVAAAQAARAALDAARSQVAVAQAGVPVAESQLAQAEAGQQQASAALRTAQTGPEQLAASRAKADAAQAQVKQAQAALEQAELNLQYTTVKAPITGIVSRKTVEIGQVIQGGQPLLALIPLQDVWITANFKETQLTHMRPGQKAVVEVDAYGGHKFYGHVDSIAAATGARFSLLPPENATGNYVKVVQRIPVKIVIDQGQDPQHLLRPGMSVTPTVYTK